MKKLKSYLKPIGIWLALIIIYLLLICLLGFTGIFSLSTITKINFVLVSLIMLLFGIISGKKASKKGYLEGLKFGGIVVLVLLLLNLIFFRVFNLYLLLYYVVLVVSAVIGSMIGINLHR